MVCRKHKKAGNNDMATDIADVCCLKKNLNVGTSWLEIVYNLTNTNSIA